MNTKFLILVLFVINAAIVFAFFGTKDFIYLPILWVVDVVVLYANYMVYKHE